MNLANLLLTFLGPGLDWVRKKCFRMVPQSHSAVLAAAEHEITAGLFASR